MNSNTEIDDFEFLDGDDSAEVSVDDFIRALEEKEKDLHITADNSVIELADDTDEEGEVPEFVKKDLAAAVTAKTTTPTVKPNTAELTRLKGEILVLKQMVSRLEAERGDILQAAQRRTKDFENYKARTERERTESLETQVGHLATQMLPAFDNLNRAVDFALQMPETTRAEFHQFLEGVVLVSQQVSEVLADMGIQPISSVGEPFDPHFHEAVATEESDEFP